MNEPNIGKHFIYSKLKYYKNILLSSDAKKVYAIIISIVLLFFMFAFVITPERYDIKIGQISPKTIVATKEITDEVSTEKERIDAVRNIEPSYISVPNISEQVLKSLDDVVKELELAQKYGQSIISQQGLTNDFYYFEQDDINYVKTLITKLKLNDYQIRTLLNTNNKGFNDLSSNIRSAVSNTLTTTIREDRLAETISYLQQIIGYKTDINLLQNIAIPVLEACIKPNMIIDKEATAKAKSLTMQSVDPVVYQKGQNIVLEGNRVYKYQYEMIKNLGLLDDKTVDTGLYLASLGFIIGIISLMLIIMYALKPRLILSRNELIIQLLCVVITSLFCIISKYINIYLAPIIMAPLLLTVLVGVRSAFSGNIAIALLNIILLAGTNTPFTEEMLNIILLSLVGGSVAIALLRKKQRRQQALVAATLAGITNFVLIILVGVFTKSNQDYVFNNALWTLLGAFLSVLLSLALEPILEFIFNIPTENRLLEITNPEQPLLRRLLLETPGTYHHSIFVANLAEAAADKIGANSLVARAGAYYHDIGKIKNPMYFTENQVADNPHLKEDPYKSAQIVINHVHNGYEIAKQYKLPDVIKDIIVSHHGTSITMYFYHEALEKSQDKNIDVYKFRYPGPKPSSKEAAIIMIADTVEAASRSMKNHSKEVMNDYIKKLIDAKISDGQLIESNLSLKDINDIKDAFITILAGVYHDRIEYPALPTQDEKENLSTNSMDLV